MIYEIREYPIKKGMRDDWVRLMEEMIIPFQKKMGMDVVGSFISLDDENTYVWIRRFENEVKRKELYDRVYGSHYWMSTVKDAMKDMLIKEDIKIQLLKATKISPLE